MKHHLTVIFGKEQVSKIYNSIPLKAEETKLNTRAYSFNSVEEKQAFLKGINEGIGWLDFCILDSETT